MFVFIVVEGLILYGMLVNFRGNQIFMGFVEFLIHEVLYAWCFKI